MEIRDYYRTKKGLICVVKTINTPETRRKKCLGYVKRNVCLVNGRHTLDDIKIHSANKLELIEKGDYVNGKLVSNVDKIDNMNVIEWDNGEIYSTEIPNDKFIKSIVTKEQFSSVEYVF